MYCISLYCIAFTRPASPSVGWEGGVDRLTGLPNGKPLVLKKSLEENSKERSTSKAYSKKQSQTERQDHTPSPSRSSPSDAAAAGARADAGGAVCTAERDVDFGKGLVWKAVPTPEPGDCCDACVAQEGCVVGLWYRKNSAHEPLCYLKNASMVQEPTWSSGFTFAMWIPGQWQCSSLCAIQ